MAVFFNGRLWISPAVMSQVNDQAMFNPNLDVGNILALVGASTRGSPNTPVMFGNPTDAVNYFGTGDLADAAGRCFDPSGDTVGPAKLMGIRVNPATQSTLALNDAAASAVIDLVSTDYGAYTKQIKVKVEAASVSGLKLTTQFGNAYFTQDNVFRNAFSIQYSGGQSTAVMTVSGTQVILQAPSGTPVATLDLSVLSTVQQLVDAINAVSSFSASVLDGNGSAPTLNGLDFVTSQDVKTALYTAVANLQAAVDWFNSAGEGFVTATRHTGAGKVPAAVAFTYLAGGSDGSITNTQWSNAFTVLQTQDIQWLTPLTSDASITAMGDAHCSFMSNVGRMERRQICGTALNTSDASAITAAKALNSDRSSLVHLGMWDYNPAGVLTLYPPYILAAMIAAAFSGVNPGTALTNKSLKIRGLERDLQNPVATDPLIQGGVLCVENTPKGYKVVKSITTWLTNRNYNRVEVSCGVALDFTCRNVREALADLKGAKGNNETLTQAVSRTDTVLSQLSKAEPLGPGVLAGDAANPPYKNITAKLVGDVIAVSFQASPVIPVNYITVTVFAVPFSGTAVAA